MRLFRSISALVACWAWMSSSLLAAPKPPGPEAVRGALTAVDRWLADSPHARAWHDRLGTDELRAELDRKRPPDPAVLERWLHQLTVGGPIPGHAPIVALRRSVEGWLALESLPHGRYLPIVATSILQSPMEDGQGGARAELRTQLIALAAMLSRYAEQPSDDLAQSIDDALRRLSAAREAKGLVDAVRHYYGHPNIWLDVSEDLLDDPVERMIERLEPVSDVILGTPLSGNSRLRAQSDLLIERAADRAILRIVVEGQVDAQTTGRRGPANIHSRSTITFRAEKQLLIEQTGLKVLPTVCKAQVLGHSSQVSATSPGLGGRIVRRIAQRRWEASQYAAHREAEQHVEQRVRATVDREANELITRLDRFVIGPMLALANQGSPTVEFRTEKGVLRIGVRHGGLGAPSGRPPVEEGQLFAVRLHSSLIGRVGGAAIADLTSPRGLQKLAFFTPLDVLEGIESALRNPTRVLQASFGSSVSRPSLAGGRLWQGLAWRWIDQTVAPRLDARGIVLRDGLWGTVTPGGLGGDWPLLGWRPARVAEGTASLNR